MNQLKRLKAAQAGQREDQPAPPRPVAPIRAAQKNPLMGLKRQQDEAPSAPVRAPRPASVPMGGLDLYQDAIDTAQAAWSVHPAMSEARTDLKRKLLDQIMSFVDAYIDHGDRYPNSVAVEAMILLFDTGDIERALSLGLSLVAQDCHVMPKRFQGKNLRHQVVRLTLDWAIAKLKESQPAAPYLDQLIRAMDAESGRWELHPILRGEAYALAAKHAAQAGEWSAAVQWCMKAQQENPGGAGVKTLLTKCLAAAKNEGETATAPR